MSMEVSGKPLSAGYGSRDTALPELPVRLFQDREDPCVRRLQVRSFDQVGLLFKLCELLTSHGIDIRSANISTEDGIVNNLFELAVSRPSDFTDSTEWCKELEGFLARNCASRGAALEGSLGSTAKPLSVNPDLLSVVNFHQIEADDMRQWEYRYNLVIAGINQAGLLTYTALVFYRCGFSVLNARISTCEGQVFDTFELSTTSSESENLLGSYFDVPTYGSRRVSVPLPFHVTQSDANVAEMVKMWGKPSAAYCSPSSPRSNSPWGSQGGSFVDEAPMAATASVDGDFVRKRTFSNQEFSTMNSSLREPLFPRKDGTTQGARNASSDGVMPSGPSDGLAGHRPLSRKDSRRMVVHFANGDVYTGHCTNFEDGEKRHGIGTYVYSPGTHESYKQYQGQWREDKKHGYGVLFYRTGGVYVGQWENNKKHGLGVLFDQSAESSDAAAMPSFRYEGQWEDDEPHGLGAEEDDASSFFGHFARGKREGRGVRMSLTKIGITGCEVQDDSGRLTPLLDALEVEMMQYSSSQASAPSQRRNLHEPEDQQMETQHHHPLLSRRRSVQAGSEHESGSSGKSGATRSPLSQKGFNALHRGDTVTPSTDSQATPLMAGAGHEAFKATADSNRGAQRSDWPLSSPSEGQPTPGPPGAGAAAASSRGDRAVAAATPDGSLPSMLREDDDATPLAYQGRLVGHARQRPPVEEEQRTSARGPLAEPVEMFEMPRDTLEPMRSGGSVEFTMWEESNLLSFSPASTFTRACTEPMAPGLNATKTIATKSGPEGIVTEGFEDQAVVEESSQAAARRPVSNPVMSLSGFTTDALLDDRSIGAGSLKGQSTPALPSADAQPVLCRRPLRTPLLWSEDELTAFIKCLGISTAVCTRVQQKKLKGVAQILEMSNSELRRDFGLLCPVERIVVRQSLKRLLYADRWENNARGHKVSDILGDSVLSHYIIPFGELTLVQKIAQGGYGTVYRGVLESAARAQSTPDRLKSNLVAVKEMKGERRVRLYELLKEARVMASLSHENICTFIGICADASARKHYILSELMDCSLFDLVHQPYKLRWHGELSVSLVVSLSKGICAGIAYIHAKNLVHADLKSSNILIDYSSSWQLFPRICDFGHAAVRAFPSPHHRCGTPHWAGPEVLRGEALGPAADIYSFGVIMWEMLTQKLPHKGLSFGQVLASVGWAGLGVELTALPEVPQELRRLLRSCLNFTPAGRPSGHDVQRRLRHIPKQARLNALKLLATFMG